MFGSLRSISPQQILENTDLIVTQDRRLTLRLLEHLYEIDRQKLYLERGFASTFDYCTKHLKLSEPSAARRIRTARCVARYPRVYALLESGELNLTVVAMVSKYLKPAKVDEIIGRIKGKPKREVERIIAEYEPKAALPPDRVRMVLVAAAPAPAAPPRLTVTGDSEKSPNPGDGPNDGKEQAPPVAIKPVQFARMARVEFNTHEELINDLERVRSVASHRLPGNAPLEQLVGFLAKYFLDREDPIRRDERREKRARNESAAHSAPLSIHRRHIPVAVRDGVFARDQRCTYVGPDGKRCESTHVLQVDHIKPVARGGSAVIENLRLLCANHNRIESERLMGKRGPRDLIREAPATYCARTRRYDQSLVV